MSQSTGSLLLLLLLLLLAESFQHDYPARADPCRFSGCGLLSKEVDWILLVITWTRRRRSAASSGPYSATIALCVEDAVEHRDKVRTWRFACHRVTAGAWSDRQAAARARPCHVVSRGGTFRSPPPLERQLCLSPPSLVQAVIIIIIHIRDGCWGKRASTLHGARKMLMMGSSRSDCDKIGACFSGGGRRPLVRVRRESCYWRARVKKHAWEAARPGDVVWAVLVP